MATIIRFPAEALAWRRNASAERSEPARTGEILFFTGVRYSRSEGAPVRHPARTGRNLALKQEERQG